MPFYDRSTSILYVPRRAGHEVFMSEDDRLRCMLGHDQGEEAEPTNHGYASDHVDSDVEEILNSSIHHQTLRSCDLGEDSADTAHQLHADEREHSYQTQDLNRSIKIVNKLAPKPKSTKKLSAQRVPDVRGSSLKQSSPSPDRSFIPCSKRSFLVSNVNSLSLDRTPVTITYGNGIELSREQVLASMDKFYNEDDYDSGNEQHRLKNMSKNKRLWMLNKEDMLDGKSKRSNRGECALCFKQGHKKIHCPTVCSFQFGILV